MNEIPRRLQQQAVESSRFAGLGHSALGAALFSRDVGNWSDSEVAPALYWNIGRACVLNPRKRAIYTRMIVEASLIAPFGKCDGIPRGINLSAARCSRGYSRRGSTPPVPSPPPSAVSLSGTGTSRNLGAGLLWKINRGLSRIAPITFHRRETSPTGVRRVWRRTRGQENRGGPRRVGGEVRLQEL